MRRYKKIVLVLFFSIFLLSFLNSADNKKDDCSKRDCMKTISDIIKSYVIVIDPGHGTGKSNDDGRTWVYDMGAPSSNNVLDENGHTYKEAHMVLDIAKKIRDLLNETSSKITVKLTRESDKVKGLGARSRAETTRTTIINKIKAEKCETTKPFFLSLHLNATTRDDNEACNNTTYHREFFAFDRNEGNNQPYELSDIFENATEIQTPKSKDKNGVLRYGPLCLKELKVTRINGKGKVIKKCIDVPIPVSLFAFEMERICFPMYIESEYSKSIITQNSLSEVDFICNDDIARRILTTETGHKIIAELYLDYFASKILKDLFSKVDVSRCITAMIPGDHPDDNESYSRGVRRGRGKGGYSVDIRSKILTSIEFINPYTIKMLNSIGERPAVYFRELSKDMVKEHPVLVIPYGSLSFQQNNTSLKETLKQYVSNGGTIVVFAQQYGKQVENIIPVPEGEKLKVYGWREDQSCYNGSVYGSIKHPVLSSMGNDRASAAVDGYIQSLEAKSLEAGNNYE